MDGDGNGSHATPPILERLSREFPWVQSFRDRAIVLRVPFSVFPADTSDGRPGLLWTPDRIPPDLRLWPESLHLFPNATWCARTLIVSDPPEPGVLFVQQSRRTDQPPGAFWLDARLLGYCGETLYFAPVALECTADAVCFSRVQSLLILADEVLRGDAHKMTPVDGNPLPQYEVRDFPPREVVQRLLQDFTAGVSIMLQDFLGASPTAIVARTRAIMADPFPMDLYQPMLHSRALDLYNVMWSVLAAFAIAHRDRATAR